MEPELGKIGAEEWATRNQKKGNSEPKYLKLGTK